MICDVVSLFIQPAILHVTLYVRNKQKLTGQLENTESEIGNGNGMHMCSRALNLIFCGYAERVEPYKLGFRLQGTIS